jgi:flavin reductase (DIM6/NTAB) family NADH-FMN oxidoreductase RutF
MRNAIRRLVRGDREPEWAPVALHEPQDLVRVELRGLGGPRDVTLNNVVVSLSPLRIGVALREEEVARARRSPLELVFDERETGRALGRLWLELVSTLGAGDPVNCVFRVTRRENACLPRVQAAIRFADDWQRNLRKRTPGNFHMTTRDIWDLQIVYFAPRPVALITVRHGHRGNLFPMDLIGPSGRYFSLALRNTAPAVELLRASRRLALSRIPADYCDIAYRLGRHHKVADIEWETLGFEVRPSATFGLLVPSDALGVHELRIDEVHGVGSHTVFLATELNAEVLRSGERLFHIPGVLQEFRRRSGRAPLPACRRETTSS